MRNINEINKMLISRKMAYVLPEEKNNLSMKLKNAIIVSFSKYLENLGFKLSVKLINKMTDLEVATLGKEMLLIENLLIEKLGGNLDYILLNNGFPNNISEEYDEKYLEALMQKENADEFLVKSLSKLKSINLANEKTLCEIWNNLLSSQVTFSEQDKEDLILIKESVDGVFNYTPNDIPNKENLIWLAINIDDGDFFIKKMKTPTDIIRLIVAKNDGDISLTNNCKFKSLPKKDIRFFADSFDKLYKKESDLYKNLELFKTIAKTYHFRNFKKHHHLQTLLDRVFNKTLERGFNSKRDISLMGRIPFDQLLDIYDASSTSNGHVLPAQILTDLIVLSRKCQEEKDYLKSKEYFLLILEENIKKVENTNILLKACAVINSKTKENKFKCSSYRTKKGMGKLYVKENTSKLIRKDLANDIQFIIKNRLFEIYSKKRELKNVYVEEELKDINISNGKRTSSKGNSIPYGSAFNLDNDTNILRTFIHWTNKENGDRIDIDSSFIFFDEDMNIQSVCSYYKLQIDYAIHSGDFTDGGRFDGPGVAEMIDINIEEAIAYGVRYVVAMVNQYTGDHFSEVPCKFGWMEFSGKKDKNFGPLKKFNKEAVKKSIELNSNCHEVLPCMIDLVERKIIWMDQQKEYVKNEPRELAAGRNADSETLGTMYSAIGALTYPSFKLYDLIQLHIMARGGTIVKNKEDANTVFTVFHANVDEFPNANEFIAAEDSDLIDADLISGKLSIYDKKE
jgi:hypothetical protein